MKRQLALDCMELIQKKLTPGVMSREEYYLALMELHKKYPMPGHNPPLTKYQLSHYMELKEVCTQEIPWRKDNGERGVTRIEYEDHLQPFNFQEGSEMFIQNWERLDKEKPTSSTWKKRIWPLMMRSESEEEVRDRKVEASGEYEEEVPF